MGAAQPSNCQGQKMTWTKSNPGSSWGKLQLAQNLNLYQNVWRQNIVTESGKSEITCNTFNGGILSWDTKFSMPCKTEHNNMVKTYTNVAWAGQETIQVKNLKAFKSAWKWKLMDPSPDLVADVSYDIFFSKDPNCRTQDCASREAMVWLGAIGGAMPADDSPANGNPKPIITVGRKYEFQVFQGTVVVPVISIIPAEKGRSFTSFEADFKGILSQLTAFGLSPDEYIVSVGAGIEIFKGSGTLQTRKYSLELY
ncbi:hypothetical protein PTTG_06695 [Puccinia triticina 1-1 BBBD Race 1]|uniref:Uncharacterized protein n=2 Tax=Puccinia triticina TaxID=208348 RepID=A0A180G8G6_PUCT1|nr:hypothetical protein PTTG_06695 [Puccinia triticina 1-1 BBBD Race 1]